jgi:hypothetical protein
MYCDSDCGVTILRLRLDGAPRLSGMVDFTIQSTQASSSRGLLPRSPLPCCHSSCHDLVIVSRQDHVNLNHESMISRFICIHKWLTHKVMHVKSGNYALLSSENHVQDMNNI